MERDGHVPHIIYIALRARIMLERQTLFCGVY